MFKLLNHLKSQHSNSRLSIFHAFFGSHSSISELINKLNIFNNNENRFSIDSIGYLTHILRERMSLLDAERDRVEIDLINPITQCTEKLHTLEAKSDDASIYIEELEEIDRQIKLKLIDIHEHSIIDIEIGSRQIRVKSEDILHYRIIKGLAISLVTRYVYKEGDNNALNNDKNGKMVDFEMTNLPLSFQFKVLDPFTKLAREPHPNSFVCTAKDIREFPDVTDADFYSWPTKQTYTLLKLMQSILVRLPDTSKDNPQINSLLDSIKEFAINLLGIKERVFYERYFSERAIRGSIDEKFQMIKPLINKLILMNQEKIESIENKMRDRLKKTKLLYTLQDNQEFKNLGLHPVFEYFKYKTFLKFLLLDSELYDFLAKLNISKSAGFIDDAFEWSLLRTAVVKENMGRRDEIEDVLTNMPEFHSFLALHGETALKQIINELSFIKEKYSKKVAEKPYYQEIVDAIDINKIVDRYKLIAGVDMSSLEHEPAVKHNRCC